MSNKIILDRDSFINEHYSKEGNELNEGILDFFLNLGKNDWSSIKSKNPDIKRDLEKIDNNLQGFTLTKLRKSGPCKAVRQQICDFANTLYDQKMQEYEDGEKLQKMLMGIRLDKDKEELTDEEKKQIKGMGKIPAYLKQFDLKDKTILDKLKNIDKNITSSCKGDAEVQRWAELLKNEVRNLINDYILDKYEKEKKNINKEKIKKQREEIKKQKEAEQKEREEADKKAKEELDKKIKEITKERESLLTNVGVHPLSSDKDGDKIITTMIDAYKKMMTTAKLSGAAKKLFESVESHDFNTIIEEGTKHKFDDPLTDSLTKAFSSDDYFGFKGLEKEDINYGKARIILKEVGAVYKVISDYMSDSNVKKAFSQTPSDAIQALFVGICKAVQYAVISKDISSDKDVLKLLARCSIDSDKTIGYGIPHVKDGNIFTAILGTLTKPGKETEAIFGGDKGEGKEVLKNFVNNMKKTFDAITKEAENIKSEQEKKNKEELKEVEKESEEKAKEKEKE